MSRLAPALRRLGAAVLTFAVALSALVVLVACDDPEPACAAKPGGGSGSSSTRSGSTSSGTRTAPRAPSRVTPRQPASKPTTYRTEHRDGRTVVVPIVVDDDLFETDCDEED
ncbi:hypothetical protein [Micromonospora sp. KC213]|uniref:hypothetical protein n=1 Tax=Micromonospora sp. KC213 TaxID=2530378 RepID=UPI0010535F22|nr:hypothetical protein [Micromonospora sp. KC213]TDC29972.1 hypothetical protein E1166_29385 [Micromonospora sp. KC213]